MYTEITNAAAENKCPEGKGQLPGRCAAMAFPFVAMQGQDPKRYDQREALQQGTLFPGLDLPFHKELKSRFPAANTALSELIRHRRAGAVSGDPCRGSGGAGPLLGIYPVGAGGESPL